MNYRRCFNYFINCSFVFRITEICILIFHRIIQRIWWLFNIQIKLLYLTRAFNIMIKRVGGKVNIFQHNVCFNLNFGEFLSFLIKNAEKSETLFVAN